MTIGNVKEAVKGFGFSYDLSDGDQVFMPALSLAIREINRLRPKTSVAAISHEPYNPVFSDSTSHMYMPDEPLSFSCMARSAVFEVDGSGNVSVEGATVGGEKEHSWNAYNGWKRIVAVAEKKEYITLTFGGNSTYHVRNVAFFDVAGTVGLKYGDYIEYDLSDVVKDFHSISYVLRDNKNYSSYDIVNGSMLRLPVNDTGMYEIIYRTKLTIGSGDDFVIPLPEDLAELVPILTASYVWLDDENEKAQYYRALFERQANMIERERYNVRIIDSRGWS